MFFKDNRAFRWFFAAIVVFIGTWLYLKNEYYQACTYVCDLFSCLDMSRSWLAGHDVLYETRYGDHSRIHNFYFLLLLAPLTSTLGALGLFVAHAALILLGSYVLLRQFGRASSDRQFHVLAFILTFVVGPYAFWIWHDPKYGWHSELLFVPLGILFSSSLMQQRTWVTLLTGALLVSVREDACVLACCIQLFHHFVSTDAPDGPSLRTRARTLALIAGGWILVFGAGLWLLAWKNGFAKARLGGAFDGLRDAPWPQTREYLETMGVELLRMLSPMAVFVFLFFRMRYLIVMLVLTLPLLAVNLVSALNYYRPHYHGTYYGLTWNTRFALVMGFQLACMVQLLALKEVSFLLPRWRPGKPLQAAACAALFALQYHELEAVRDFDAVGEYVTTLSKAPDQRVATLRCLAGLVPTTAHVTVPYRYYALFEWHRFMWLEPDYGPGMPGIGNAPVREPDVIMFEDETETHLELVPHAYYLKDRIGGIGIWHKPHLRLDLSRCR